MKSRTPMAALAACSLLVSGCGPLILAGAATEGARSIFEERTTGAALSDTEIQLTLNNRYLNRGDGLFRNVSTNVHEGRVVLTGSVPSQQDKIDAMTIAWEVPGVASVTDEIVVGSGGGVGGYAEDAWISTQLRTKLLTDLSIRSQNYNVETVGKVVHIMGLARSDLELSRVISHAQRVSGVERIVSHVLTIDDPRRVAQVSG